MLFPKGTSINDDEDLIELFEEIRKLGIAGNDELDELAGLVKAKITRYARRTGMNPVTARVYGRSVALPLVRAADALMAAAAYAKVGKNRLDAFLVALDDDTAVRSDFEVKGRKAR